MASEHISDETKRFLEAEWRPINIEVEGDVLTHMSVETEDGEVFEFDGEMDISNAGWVGPPHDPKHPNGR